MAGDRMPAWPRSKEIPSWLSNQLIMERPKGIGHKGGRYFRPELKAVLAHRIHHPAKRDVGDIVAWVAAADIAMSTPEPDLL